MQTNESLPPRINRKYTNNKGNPSTINPFGRGFVMAALNINSLLALACEQAPVGDSRVQSRANGMSRERSGEEGVRRGACRHSIDAAVP